MATTQAQRASLFNTLAELMGEEDAETLTQQLPPGGWDSMATKDDLKVLGATFAAALAEFRVEITNALTELRIEITNGLAEAAKERAEIIKSQAEIRIEITNGLAEAAKERAEIIKSQAELRIEITNGLAEAAKERAEIIKSQARHLYVTVSTIVLATVSIWIALLAGPTGG